MIEVTNPDDELRSFLQSKNFEHEDLGHRIIVYGDENDQLFNLVSDLFCRENCTLRMSTLEDVFLRLTGRELRE